MADEFLVGYLTFSFFITIFFFIFLVFLIRRRKKRGYVWLEVKTPSRTVVKQVPPNRDGRTVSFRAAKGRDEHLYYLMPEAMEHYDGGWVFPDPKPRFRFVEGKPFPYRYATKKVTSNNPGHDVVRYESWDEPVTPSSRALQVFFDDDTLAQVYHNRLNAILVLLLLAILFIGIMVIGLYARG